MDDISEAENEQDLTKEQVNRLLEHHVKELGFDSVEEAEKNIDKVPHTVLRYEVEFLLNVR